MIRITAFSVGIVATVIGLFALVQSQMFGTSVWQPQITPASKQPTTIPEHFLPEPFSPFPPTQIEAEVGAGTVQVSDTTQWPQATIVPMPTAGATKVLSIVTHTETKKYVTLGDHRVRSDVVEIRLSQFPKPEQDNGRGLHWFPTTSQKRDVVDRFMPELVAMKIRWLVILQGVEDWNLTANDYLVDKLNAAGIIPVMRLEMKVGAVDPVKLERVVVHYREKGVRYFQVFNEPNVREEWTVREFPTPKEFMAHWIPIAEVVAQHGGLPGLAPLSPTANHTDEIFLEQEFQILLREKRYDLINNMWLAVHNYGGMDENGFLRYQKYARIGKFYFRQNLPMLSTEGGIGDVQSSSETVIRAFDAMNTREPWFLAYSPWLIGNNVGGGHDDTWESQAWFQGGGPLPIVERVKNLP